MTWKEWYLKLKENFQLMALSYHVNRLEWVFFLSYVGAIASFIAAFVAVPVIFGLLTIMFAVISVLAMQEWKP